MLKDSFEQNHSVGPNYPSPKCSLTSSLVNRDFNELLREPSLCDLHPPYWEVEWTGSWLLSWEIQGGRQVTDYRSGELLRRVGTSLSSQKLQGKEHTSIPMCLHWPYTSKSQCEVSISRVQQEGKDSSNKKLRWSSDMLELTDEASNWYSFASPPPTKTTRGEESPAMGITEGAMKEPQREWMLSTCLSQLTLAHLGEELYYNLYLPASLCPLSFFPAGDNKKLWVERKSEEERKEGHDPLSHAGGQAEGKKMRDKSITKYGLLQRTEDSNFWMLVTWIHCGHVFYLGKIHWTCSHF